MCSLYFDYFNLLYALCSLGSSAVTDEGLKRACYVVRALFGSRYDIRSAYYKMFGRVALIGDSEQQTSLYEYW